MSNEHLSSPAVVMFDRTTGQSFSSSNFTAAGRDHINLNIHLATAGTGYPFPVTPEGQESAGAPSPPVIQDAQSIHPSFLTRVYRRLRARSRRQPRANGQRVQDPETTPPIPVAQRSQPAPPPPSPASDLVVLPDGSSISSFDSHSQMPPSRLRVSSEEEVYERSLLPKGHGYPLFKPSPLGKPAKIGEFGILGQDGFESFGNIFDPNDQREFLLERPPEPCTTHQPETLPEGQVISTGIEEAPRLMGPGENVPNSFAFHCRQTQGAILALTSSGELETLTPKSRNQLREYLCSHGTRLMVHLRRQRYLEAGQSLYVVTGAIKSSSWAIAVHASPMREPYDQLVLSRRQGKVWPTYEWTSRGGADARCGSSATVGENGERTKDQSLFLRGFLLTPSSDLERQVKTDANLFAGDADPSAGYPDSEGSDYTDEKGHSTSKDQPQKQDSDRCRSLSGSHSQRQLQNSLADHCSVEQFPALPSNSKCYYPSRRVNEILLENNNVALAITHDDDWGQTAAGDYLDDKAVCSLIASFWETNNSKVYHRVATTVPLTTLARGLSQDVEVLATHSAGAESPIHELPLTSLKGLQSLELDIPTNPRVTTFLPDLHSTEHQLSLTSGESFSPKPEGFISAAFAESLSSSTAFGGMQMKSQAKAQRPLHNRKQLIQRIGYQAAHIGELMQEINPTDNTSQYRHEFCPNPALPWRPNPVHENTGTSKKLECFFEPGTAQLDPDGPQMPSALKEFQQTMDVKPYRNFEEWDGDPDPEAARFLYPDIDNLKPEAEILIKGSNTHPQCIPSEGTAMDPTLCGAVGLVPCDRKSERKRRPKAAWSLIDGPKCRRSILSADPVYQSEKSQLHHRISDDTQHLTRPGGTGNLLDLHDGPIVKMGVGKIYDVHRGTWKGQEVAIKVLKLETFKETRDENSFAREVGVWRLLQDTARGLEYLHSHSAAPRDIKATNILIDDSKRCFISDFGVSRTMMPTESSYIDAPRWQAPELLEGANCSTIHSNLDTTNLLAMENGSIKPSNLDALWKTMKPEHSGIHYNFEAANKSTVLISDFGADHPAGVACAAAHSKRTIPKFGPYLLLQALGEGAFGKVKLGLDDQRGEEVAVEAKGFLGSPNCAAPDLIQFERPSETFDFNTWDAVLTSLRGHRPWSEAKTSCVSGISYPIKDEVPPDLANGSEKFGSFREILQNCHRGRKLSRDPKSLRDSPLELNDLLTQADSACSPLSRGQLLCPSVGEILKLSAFRLETEYLLSEKKEPNSTESREPCHLHFNDAMLSVKAGGLFLFSSNWDGMEYAGSERDLIPVWNIRGLNFSLEARTPKVLPSKSLPSRYHHSCLRRNVRPECPTCLLRATTGGQQREDTIDNVKRSSPRRVG